MTAPLKNNRKVKKRKPRAGIKPAPAGKGPARGVSNDKQKKKIVGIKRRHSEKEFRELLENSRDAYSLVDLKGREISWNAAFERLLGYSGEELRKKTYQEITPRKWHALEEKIVRKQILVRGYSDIYEKEYIRKDGSFVPVELRVHLSRDESGRPDGMYAFMRDITKRKKAEEAVQGANTRLASLIDASPDIIYFKDLKGRYLLGNQTFARTFNLDINMIAGKKDGDILPRKLVAACRKSDREVMIRRESIQAREVLPSSGGGKVIFKTLKFPIFNDRGDLAGIGGISRDVTEEEKMEEELQKAQKLESLGILAGGIAHDFNNILMALVGNISLAKQKADPQSEIFRVLEEAEVAYNQARNLTRQLLTFSRGGQPVTRTFSLERLLEETTRFALSGSRSRYRLTVPDDLWMVEADEGQFDQIINNLVINADQAMPEGGTIIIRAENYLLAGEAGLPLPEGRYVRITIADKGLGIPKKYLSRVFDPYFTTKEKGSGLGLATAYSIIKKHQGLITVRSRVGRGTTFTIYLPAAARQVFDKAGVEEEKAASGRGRILIMDDEIMVREVVAGMLSHLGYQVETAAEGKTALALYQKARQDGRPFELVILDLTIPGGMGGAKVINRLLRINPEVKAVASSGYPTDPIISDFRRFGFSGILLKPYRIEELSRTLRKFLSSKTDHS